MKSIDFTGISGTYSKKSVVQKAASDILINMLNIQKGDDILDIGCGTGKITRKLADLTTGRVVGIDPSQGMISMANEENIAKNIEYRVQSAEAIHFNNEFDIIFCNSALQWFKDLNRVAENFNNSLKKSGKIAIQAPASKNYCPNFLEGIENVRTNPLTRLIFKSFKSPFYFADTEAEYREIFEKVGLIVKKCWFEEIESYHTPDEVFDIFSSGAAAGYINQDYYEETFTEEYVLNFQQIMKEAFAHQADEEGSVKLIFIRIYILATKP